jgi:hypothetical protein
MTKSELDDLFKEVIDQLTSHLRQSHSIQDAQRLHKKFCTEMHSQVVLIPGESLSVFLKDIAIAFAEEFQFDRNPLLDSLRDGTDETTLESLIATKAIRLCPDVSAAWQYVAKQDERSAVVVVAICYRLFIGRKLDKLKSAETRFAKEHQKLVSANSQQEEENE